MFLFGGHDYVSDEVTANLIAIDVEELLWWYVKVQGGPVDSRIESSMLGIDRRIYIFGGKSLFDEDAPAFASYSIAEYLPDNGEWRWVVRDHPYPSHLPALGSGGRAITVYNGKKILLIPGRSNTYSVGLIFIACLCLSLIFCILSL